MTESAPRYADWKAPAQDGEVLLWPDGQTLLEETRRNGALLNGATHVRIAGIPLPELRQQLRQWIGHADTDRPIIATGHQTELHHPGVWVKNAVIDAAATKLGGAAYHFAVDTDEPKHLHLKWPGGMEPITDDANLNRAPWSAMLAAPIPGHLQKIEEEYTDAAGHWKFKTLVPTFLRQLRRLTVESGTLSATLTNALHALDWELGLRHHALLLSPICFSEPYLAFVHHVISNADRFAADYNESLEEYRVANRIRTPGRPMPNLAVSGDACEVPFWCDDLSAGQRVRAKVTRMGDGPWMLQTPGGEPIGFDRSQDGRAAAVHLARFLRQQNLRIAPRALSLTMVLRLLVADHFVHGIGGARYDQVADRLIERHFDLEAPRFSVATATLFFPGAAGQERTCVRCIRQEGHRLRHSILGSRKLEMVGAIDALPRGSRDRSAIFFGMHGQLDAAAEVSPALNQWRKRLSEAENRDIEEKDLFDRELFYGIQSPERLEGMIGRYRAMF